MFVRGRRCPVDSGVHESLRGPLHELRSLGTSETRDISEPYERLDTAGGADGECEAVDLLCTEAVACRREGIFEPADGPVRAMEVLDKPPGVLSLPSRCASAGVRGATRYIRTRLASQSPGAVLDGRQPVGGRSPSRTGGLSLT